MLGANALPGTRPRGVSTRNAAISARPRRRRIGGKANKENGKDNEKEEYLDEEEREENADKARLEELLTLLELEEWFKKVGQKEEKTEGEKLDNCGCETDLYLGLGFSKYLGRLDIPYKEFRSMFDGEYVENEGYIVELDHNQFNDLIRYLEMNQIADMEPVMN